ncbi:hypothetical protein ACSYGW_13130 [Bacillus glycinifermentans]|uniref:hypothetical protein n=1 Tax=Bacillus glycinifermentans TaxID=1664069 RepID=UPI002DB7A420|nr:hypothetical protein [Bacillus glycinifermentans]MEC0495969.1 hypothetical protein [Bacillus glycinifermentans]MEC0539088.1 hypothetical protein [Bacillus glycinifermentans]
MKETPFYKTNWFTILMIIVLFPVGLILMWFNKKWTVLTRTIVSCVVVVLAVVGYFNQSPQSENVAVQVEEHKEKTKPAKETNKEEKPQNNQVAIIDKGIKNKKEETKSEKEDPEVAHKEKSKEDIQKIIEKTVGNKSGDEPKISDLEVSDLLESDTKTVRTVNVTFNGDDNLTTKMIKNGMLIEAEKLFPTIFGDKKVGRVILTWKFPLVDTKGNSESKKVLSIQIERKTNDEINWDNFDCNNFATVADHYYEHPALNKE